VATVHLGLVTVRAMRRVVIGPFNFPAEDIYLYHSFGERLQRLLPLYVGADR